MKNLKRTLSYSLYALLAVLLLASCNDPKQFVYEGQGLIVTGIELTEADEMNRGSKIYHTRDQSGEVKIWSNSEFKIGDTLKFTTHYR